MAGRNLGVFAVSGDVHVEDVFPIPLFGRARFDLGHVDLAGVEGLEGFDECARPITDGEEKGGAVIARGWAGFLADDEEARRVGGAVPEWTPREFRGRRALPPAFRRGLRRLGLRFPLARWAALVVEETSTKSAFGKLRRIQFLH